MARIAARQHGVVTARQLLATGLGRSGIDRRVARGVLHRVHLGVYRVGHLAPSPEARYLAAVLACGDGAVLSGRAAAFMHGLLKGGAPRPEVSTVADRKVTGVMTRRVRRLDRRDITRNRGIPVTTVARTVVDLAPELSLDALAHAAHEAQVRHRLTAARAEAALSRRPNTPGAWKLHEIFSGEARVTLSELERRFLDLLGSAGLPLPATNRPTGGRYVDCRWSNRRLTVELDGYRYHHSRHAWEQDRRRKREARARGDEFRRYTYGDVSENHALTLAELRELLT